MEGGSGERLGPSGPTEGVLGGDYDIRVYSAVPAESNRIPGRELLVGGCHRHAYAIRPQQGNRTKAASVVTQTDFEYRTALVNLRAEVETTTQELRASRAKANAVAADQLKLAQ